MELALIILSFILFIIIPTTRLFYYGYKYAKLMDDKYPEKAKEISTIPGLGPGNSNPFRSLPFLFNKEDFGNKELLRLKIKSRNAFLYWLFGIPAFLFILYITDRPS